MGVVAAVIGAAAATFGPVLSGAAASTIFGLSAIGSFLARVAIGVALNALSPKPKTKGANRGYTITARTAAASHQIIYGETRVGSVSVFEAASGSSNKYFHRVYAVAGHEIESYEKVYIDDFVVTEWRRADDRTTVVTPASVTDTGINVVPWELMQVGVDGNTIAGTETNRYVGGGTNQMAMRFYSGAQTTADSTLVSDVTEWTTDHKLLGIAYVVANFGFAPDTYPNGIPELTWQVKGKKVYDPRTSTTVWSDTPALCVRDYVSQAYGLNEADANIDDTTVTTAANACEETSTLAGTKRYTCNGAFTTDVVPTDIIGDLLTSMGGLLWYSQGKWRMKAAEWVAPTVSFDENDLRSSISLSTRQSRRDNFNTARGTFKGPETSWQVTDFPAVTSSAFVTEDGGEESTIDLDLPFTDNSIEARRIARIFLERNRQQLSVSAAFGLKALKVQVGDVINLSIDRFGWTNKAFEVSSWTFTFGEQGDLQVLMSLREISSNVFDEVDDGITLSLDNTDLPNQFFTPAISLTVTQPVRVIDDKPNRIIALDVATTSGDDSEVSAVRFSYKKSTDSVYKPLVTGEIGETVITQLPPDTYDIRATAVNTYGFAGDPVEETSFSFRGPVVNKFGETYNGAFETLDLSGWADEGFFTVITPKSKDDGSATNLEKDCPFEAMIKIDPADGTTPGSAEQVGSSVADEYAFLSWENLIPVNAGKNLSFEFYQVEVDGAATFDAFGTIVYLQYFDRDQNQLYESSSVGTSSVRKGRKYKIDTVGTTDWTTWGAASNAVGVEFRATKTDALDSTTGTVFQEEREYALTDFVLQPVEEWARFSGNSVVPDGAAFAKFRLVIPDDSATLNTAAYYSGISVFTSETAALLEQEGIMETSKTSVSSFSLATDNTLEDVASTTVTVPGLLGGTNGQTSNIFATATGNLNFTGTATVTLRLVIDGTIRASQVIKDDGGFTLTANVPETPGDVDVKLRAESTDVSAMTFTEAAITGTVQKR